MLIDNVRITVKAGNGGNGAVSFLRNGQKARGGPDGGNGGNGGDIYFKGSTNINDLKEFRYKKTIIGINGVDGGRNNLYGKNAEHKTVLLPIGTIVTNLNNNNQFEIRDENPVLIAKGGKGGRGNNEFKTATRQTPKYAEKGELGEEKDLNLELKLIADIGLIGLPNAGKSTLLSLLTNANPKIGNYPFTTLEPNIGVMGEVVLADIPGLIEGASTGKGLGTKFLKHIEKTKALAHLIDVSSSNPITDYKTVRNELISYNKEFENKKEIIILTKTDLKTPEEIKEILKKFKNKNVILSSAIDEDSIIKLKENLKTSIHE